MIEVKMNPQQGHWILANVGKRVLRPGGLELTNIMIENLSINVDDDVIEFAPGLGFTAKLSCAKGPKSYIGVELNQEASEIIKKNVDFERMKIVVANASATDLGSETATKVYCEAMLSMQSENHKRAIMKEAARLLKKGGLFGIHEVGLCPEDISVEKKKEIEKDMSKAIKVKVRPLTTAEWSHLLELEGLKVLKIAYNPMHLLELKRMIKDEGFFRALKIIFRVVRNKDIRTRVLQMKNTFSKHDKNINAISIVAEKL